MHYPRKIVMQKGCRLGLGLELGLGLTKKR